MRVAAEDQQGAAEQDGWVEVPRVAALLQDEPANASVADEHEWMHIATSPFCLFFLSERGAEMWVASYQVRVLTS